jgi:UDP-N-acetylglucosamine transferase subunit ALG13
VTTGSGDYPFTRLLSEADRLAPLFRIPFLLQTGQANPAPKNARYFRFTDYDSFVKMYRDATLVVSHVSSGPLAYARMFEKPIILIPRRKELGEAVSNHQISAAGRLQALREPMRLILEDVSNLKDAVENMLILAQNSERYRTGGAEIASLRQEIRKACGLSVG